jgi:anti-anti-sigma factor
MGGGDELPDMAAEHRVVLDLQRVIMPAGLAVLPDVSLAAAYLPAGSHLAAGGDWFDVVTVPDGGLGLVVGDVVGHGASASAVMGQLRAVAAERLLSGAPLADVLSSLDTFAATVPGARGTTVCVAVLDRDTGRLRYATRGHPPPLVVSADGTTRFLAQSPGSALALDPVHSSGAQITLAAGDTLVLYSDGVVEQPGRTIDDGMAALASCAAEVVRRDDVRRHRDRGGRWIADMICGAVIGNLVGHWPITDDMCILGATVGLAAPEPLAITVPATPAQLGPIRQRLAGWLAELAVDEDDLVSVELAVIEGVTNAIEHAYPGPPGEVQVDAELRPDGQVRVTVTDRGRWKHHQHDPGFRGRGLVMMRECMDQMRLDTSEGGTRVAMDRMVRRPLTPQVSRELASQRQPTELAIEVDIQPDTVLVTATGPVDSASVGRLRDGLLEAARIGSLPLTIDLDGVSLLASAGLRLLYEQGRGLRETGSVMRVVAAPGSPARNALTVGGLAEVLGVTP